MPRYLTYLEYSIDANLLQFEIWINVRTYFLAISNLSSNPCLTGMSVLTYDQQCFTDQTMQIHLFTLKCSTEELSIPVAVLQYDKLNNISV